MAREFINFLQPINWLELLFMIFVGIAGKQDRRIRIYNVEKNWEVQKDIQARNLRWTVTDTALSPDQRFLVSSIKLMKTPRVR